MSEKNEKGQTNTGKRLPHDRRVEPDRRPSMRLMDRDQEIIKAVYEHRFLKMSQIRDLFFGSQSTTNYRLVRLYQNEFLDRIYPRVSRSEGRSEAVYCLDTRGARVVAAEYGVDRASISWRPRHNDVKYWFLNHTLKVNDVWIAAKKAAEMREGQELEEWRGEKEIQDRIPYSKARKGYLPYTPDGYFVYRVGERVAHFFLEVDLATVPNTRFGKRIKRYVLYRKKGIFNDKYEAHAFRLLIVTTSQRRLRNLKATTEKEGGKNMFWFTTFEEVKPERFVGRVWKIAGQEGLASLAPSDPA